MSFWPLSGSLYIQILSPIRHPQLMMDDESPGRIRERKKRVDYEIRIRTNKIFYSFIILYEMTYKNKITFLKFIFHFSSIFKYLLIVFFEYFICIKWRAFWGVAPFLNLDPLPLKKYRYRHYRTGFKNSDLYPYQKLVQNKITNKHFIDVIYSGLCSSLTNLCILLILVEHGWT